MLVKPSGATSLSKGRKAPVKLGVGQLEVNATFVVLPIGAKSMEPEPFVSSWIEKSIELPGVNSWLASRLMDMPEWMML